MIVYRKYYSQLTFSYRIIMYMFLKKKKKTKTAFSITGTIIADNQN